MSLPNTHASKILQIFPWYDCDEMKFLIQLVIAFVRLFPQFAEILNTLKKLY